MSEARTEATVSEESKSKVGVVIVNYNAGPHLLNTVRSVASQQPTNAEITKIVVVDNGSSDDSIAQLQQELSTEKRLEVVLGSNVGFGAGNNAGADRLTECDVLALINPDTVLHEHAVQNAIATLLGDENIAMVGARLLNLDGSLYPSARAFPSLSNAIGHGLFSLFWPNNKWSRRYKRLDLDYETTHDVDWVSGAAMFVRRAAFDQVGGFDDSYFMYFEDTDLCWRIRNAANARSNTEAKWRIVYEPSAVITHVQGVSTKARAYRMLKEHHRSAIRFNLRTARGFERCLLPILIAGLLARLPVAWLQQWWIARKR